MSNKAVRLADLLHRTDCAAAQLVLVHAVRQLATLKCSSTDFIPHQAINVLNFAKDHFHHDATINKSGRTAVRCGCLMLGVAVARTNSKMVCS